MIKIFFLLALFFSFAAHAKKSEGDPQSLCTDMFGKLVEARQKLVAQNQISKKKLEELNSIKPKTLTEDQKKKYAEMQKKEEELTRDPPFLISGKLDAEYEKLKNPEMKREFLAKHMKASMNACSAKLLEINERCKNEVYKALECAQKSMPETLATFEKESPFIAWMIASKKRPEPKSTSAIQH